MKGNLKFLLAVSILAVTALACQALNNVPGAGDPVEPTSAPVEPVEPVARRIRKFLLPPRNPPRPPVMSFLRTIFPPSSGAPAPTRIVPSNT